MADDAKAVAEKGVNDLANAAQADLGNALEGLSKGDVSSVMPLIDSYIVPVITAVVLLIVGYMVASFFSRAAAKPITKRVDQTLGRFVSKLVFYSIMVLTILGVLGKFGVSVASFAAVVAAAGFAVGLAFQGTLSNFAAGVLLLVFRPFKVGDVVSAGGVTGKVFEIDLFTTVFDTPDNRRIIVPNSAISSATIENVSFHSERRVDVAVGVDYTAGIDETRAALSTAAETLREKMITGEGREYQVVLGDLGDSAVNWVVRFWTKSDDYWAVKELLTAAVKNQLDAANIGIPYPQMDIHLDVQNEALEKRLLGNAG